MTDSVQVQLDSSDPAQSGWNALPSRSQRVICCDGCERITTLRFGADIVRQWTNPLEALAWMEHDTCEGPAEGHWVGYLSYDLGRLFENLPVIATNDLKLPLFAFAHVESKSTSSPEPNHKTQSSGRIIYPSSNFSRDEYLAAVARSIGYIRAGDVFQINLSQRFTAPLKEAPEVVYRRLMNKSPARFGALLDFGDHALICNSPELFLRVDRDPATGHRQVVTRPIKGTRPRRAGMETELALSAKDQAELNMIVDLERNDLGRVCQVGSVRVSQPRIIEAHPTVFHGAATIEGVLRDNISFVDLLRATFPGGSVTGAPKIRAMEIIEELEPVRRGPYCGAIGYLSANGQMQFNVAIRTMIAKDGVIHISVGGGIVADSDPASEYEETLVKTEAMFSALGLSMPR